MGGVQASVNLSPVKLTLAFQAGSPSTQRFRHRVFYAHGTTVYSVRDSRPVAEHKHMVVQSGSLPLLDQLQRSFLSACRQKGPRIPAQCLPVRTALKAT